MYKVIEETIENNKDNEVVKQFATPELYRYKLIEKENLHYCFKEFEPYIKKCKFASCNHTKEKSCAVVDALKNERISESRYKSYIFMLDELRKSEMLKYK